MSKKKNSQNAINAVSAVEIYEAGPFDLHALSQLFDAYRQFYKQESDVPAVKMFLEERLKNQDSVIFIAFNEEGNAVAFTQLYPLISSVGMKKTWLLNDLYVDPAFRGQGISRELIERSKELARTTNANGLHLETEKTNNIGLKLYPSEGFELNNSSNFYFWRCI